MEAALSALAERDQQVLLRVTRTALKIAQNLLSDPDEAKYKRVRTASKVGRARGAGRRPLTHHLFICRPIPSSPLPPPSSLPRGAPSCSM